jgi:hypothetical protein
MLTGWLWVLSCCGLCRQCLIRNRRTLIWALRTCVNLTRWMGHVMCHVWSHMTRLRNPGGQMIMWRVTWPTFDVWTRKNCDNQVRTVGGVICWKAGGWCHNPWSKVHSNAISKSIPTFALLSTPCPLCSYSNLYPNVSLSYLCLHSPSSYCLAHCSCPHVTLLLYCGFGCPKDYFSFFFLSHFHFHFLFGHCWLDSHVTSCPGIKAPGHVLDSPDKSYRALA